MKFVAFKTIVDAFESKIGRDLEPGGKRRLKETKFFTLDEIADRSREDLIRVAE